MATDKETIQSAMLSKNGKHIRTRERKGPSLGIIHWWSQYGRNPNGPDQWGFASSVDSLLLIIRMDAPDSTLSYLASWHILVREKTPDSIFVLKIISLFSWYVPSDLVNTSVQFPCCKSWFFFTMLTLTPEEKRHVWFLRRMGQWLRLQEVLSMSETWTCLSPSNIWETHLPCSR